MSEQPVTVGSIDTLPEPDLYHHEQWTVTEFCIKPLERHCWIRQKHDFGTPLSVYHRRVLVGTPGCPHGYDEQDGWVGPAGHDQDGQWQDGILDPQAVRAYLKSPEAQALLRRICDGYWVQWDGHNDVGMLTDDACSAFTDILDGLAGVRSCYDGAVDGGWLYEWTVDTDWAARLRAADEGTLAEIEAEVIQHAEEDRIWLAFDVADELRRCQQSLREDASALR